MEFFRHIIKRPVDTIQWAALDTQMNFENSIFSKKNEILEKKIVKNSKFTRRIPPEKFLGCFYSPISSV